MNELEILEDQLRKEYGLSAIVRTTTTEVKQSSTDAPFPTVMTAAVAEAYVAQIKTLAAQASYRSEISELESYWRHQLSEQKKIDKSGVAFGNKIKAESGVVYKTFSI